MLTLTNRIDMRPGAVPLVVHLGQYDSDFTLVFELYSSAGNFTVESGTTAMIRGTKTDGHAYDADATIDVSAKTVTVAGSEQMTAAKGRNVYELVLTKSGKVLSTANFILDVERAAMDADTIASESVLKELNAIIAGAATSTQAAVDAASAADRAEDAAESVSSASTQIATNTADIADLKADLGDLDENVSELKNALNDVYSEVKTTDVYGVHGNYEGAGHSTYSGAWDADTKIASMTIPSDLGSTTTAMVYFSPKFLNGHKYKIAIKLDWANTDNVYYIIGMNRPSIQSVSGIQYFANTVLVRKGDVAVYTLDANTDGYFGIGARATKANTFNFKVSVYDVTDIDLTGISDDVFKTFGNELTLYESGKLDDIKNLALYAYNLTANAKGEVWSALGDSLTAVGSGGHYLTYTANKIGLSEYKNCGIGGTTISGAENANAMYQDTRVNSLDINSQCVTIMGGTNDFWQEYYKDHPSANYTGWGDCARDNHDVSTFCGAYNILISKIMYKFCLVPAYYSDVDYTGVVQTATTIDNFRLILITPPQRFKASADSASESLIISGITSAHSYVKQIAELWGLPCVDSWEMGMNDISKPLFFANYQTDAVHFNVFGHERLASLLIDKALQVSRYK